jgi:hypothetical protein
MLDIQLGPEQHADDLVVFPLLSPETVELPYDLLSDALAAGTVRVGEVGQGTVPTLLVENLGERTVLVLDGEQLIGAKQNRTTNRSMLLGAKQDTEIPVSCMEQGRWRFHDRRFRSSPDHSPSKVRRRAREVEMEAVRARRAPAPEALAGAQGAVWGEIGELSAKLGVRSDTGALDEAYEARRLDLDAWANDFPTVEGQVGLLALTPQGALGLDVIGSQVLYARVHHRLLNGYLMDGLDRDALGHGRRNHAPPYRFADPRTTRADDDGQWPEVLARRFMRRVTGSTRTAAPTVGLGRYSVLTKTVIGGELVDDGRLAHLSAFPRQDTRPERGWRWRV